MVGLAGEDVLLAVPLAARQLVGDLDAVAVRIFQVDAYGDAVVGHEVDFDALCLCPDVELLQVVQVMHLPAGVVQAHASLFRAGSVGPHRNQGHLVGLLYVRRQEGNLARHHVVGVQAKDIGVPLPRYLGVTDKEVGML